MRIVSFVITAAVLILSGYLLGSKHAMIVHAAQDAPTYGPVQGTVPKSYGRVAAVIADQIGTGLVFEDAEGIIRFVSMTGMKEGELARYDGSPTHGGIPKSYGHLTGAVVNPKGTALIFEDTAGVIRFVTIAGKLEGELTRN
jgi:hypothetical protein